MTIYEVECICGWSVKTNDRDLMIAASTKHDRVCADPKPDGDGPREQHPTLHP